MQIVDEVYAWCVENLDRYVAEGVTCDLKSPVSRPGSPVISLAESFGYCGNVLDVFLWEAGHLEVNVYRAATRELSNTYNDVKSGSEASRLIMGYLDELVRMEPGEPLPPR